MAALSYPIIVQGGRGDGLRIAEGFSLPLSTLTEKNAVIGMTGSGKSYFFRVLAEEILTTGIPFAIMDPLGAAWGLRRSEDGETEHNNIAVFGGEHQDFPLRPGSGADIAAFILEEKVPAILDFSETDEGIMYEVAADFMESVFERNREPFHTQFDEADLFFPQTPERGNEEQKRLIKIGKQFAVRGRMKGLGVTIATQRPASVNKTILGMARNVFALQLTGSRDLEAIKEWMGGHLSREDADELLRTLPHLGRGEAFLSSPGGEGFHRLKIRRTRTFDSSRTPPIEDYGFTPKTLTPATLDRYREKFAPGEKEEVPSPLDVEAFMTRWRGAFTKGEEAALRALATRHPKGMTSKEIGNAAGYPLMSGYFYKGLGRLKELGLVEENAGLYRLTKDCIKE